MCDVVTRGVEQNEINQIFYLSIYSKYILKTKTFKLNIVSSRKMNLV